MFKFDGHPRIPLRRRPYFIDDAAESSSAEMQQGFFGEGIGGSRESLDPAVQKTLALIRKTVSPDRALHDKVRSYTPPFLTYCMCCAANIFFRRIPFVGRRGIHFVC
jgi:hypothetical protein